MRRRVSFRPEAFADIAEAFSWYDAQRRGLGEEFEAAIDQTIKLLERMAEAAPEVHRGLRRALVHRFPFAIYYFVTGSEVEVRGVIHTSRHPRRWQDRA